MHPIAQVPTLASLLDGHSGSSNPLVLASEQTLKRDADLLEESSFALLMQQCES